MNNHEILIDHLDKKMQGELLPEAEELLARDSNAREEWQYLQAAVEAVQHNALHEKVAAIRAEMQAAPVVSIKRPVAVTRRIIRIAAAVVLLAGAFTIYKFATVSIDKFYNEHYSSYTLSTTRSDIAATPLEEAYRNSNWNEVVQQYNALATKTNKEHFLAGMAALELKQPAQAIERFNSVLTNNVQSGDNYFQDEADYYLALAYLADNRPNIAGDWLRRISATAGHLYQQRAKNMLGLDLKILELK